MTERFRMPDPGEGVHEVRITEVHVKKGDKVADGETIFSIESDKAAVDVPAPFDGIVEEVRVSDGDAVNVGDVLLSYSEGDDDRADAGTGSRKQADEEPKDASAADDDSDDADADDTNDDTGRSRRKSARSSDRADESEKPFAKRDRGSETEADARKHKARKTKEARGKTTESSGDTEPSGDADEVREASDGEPSGRAAEKERDEQDGRDRKDDAPRKSAGAEPPKAAPSTRRLARQLGVDLQDVEGSGPQDRVLAADVEAVAEQRARRTQAEDDARTDETPAAEQRLPAERVPLRGIRRTTARRMSEAWSTIPHVTHQDIVDITELERFRREQKRRVAGEGGKLTITILVIKALAATLRAFPRFNACLDSDTEQIVMKHRYHIGFAVATDDGLLVPVLRHADRKSLLELAVEAADLAERARARDLRPSELRGGTFTLTNVGSIGGTAFSPIINPPQAAILGLARARPEVAVTGDFDNYRLAPRLMLPLMLAFDHRLNDGADAARFMAHLTAALADPEQFALRA